MTTRGNTFVKLYQRSTAWETQSMYARGVGLEFYVRFQDQPVRIAGADWRATVAQALAVGGHERPSFYKALNTLRDAGLLMVGETSVQLLWTDAAVSARQHHANGTGESRQRQEISTPAARDNHAVVTPSSRNDLTPRKHSPPDPTQDRKKEDREREARAREDFGSSEIERELGEPFPGQPLPAFIDAAYTKRFHTAFAPAFPSFGEAYAKAKVRLAIWARANADSFNTTDEALVERVLDGLFANDRAREKRCQLSWAAHDPLEYLGKIRPTEPPDVQAKRARAAELVEQIERIERMDSFERTGADLERKVTLTKELAKISATLPRREAAA